jgi:anti-sigma factor RsiW
MTEDHEAIEELLAGYVLRSLSGEDAAEADRLLVEHVPGCAPCRATLESFDGVAGELALDAPPLAPPDLLLPRLRRELWAPTRRRRPFSILAAAASLLVAVGLGGLAVSSGLSASDARARADLFQRALDAARLPGATVTSLGPLSEVEAPGLEEFYLYGSGIPDPAPGTVYRVWLGAGGSYRHVLDFVPEGGVAILHLEFDPNTFDEIVITQEPAGSEPTAPGAVRWQAAV